jgi:NADPH:quinone reductase-like Zn-dependent oxidoreductase
MKAIVYTQYGSPDVLQLQDVKKPTPKPNEILIKVHTNSLNFGDLIARKFNTVTARTFSMPGLFWLMARVAFGINKPKINILGNEFAGEVEAVGNAVTRFKAGDVVFGFRGAKMGANTEYLCMKETDLVTIKPANISCEEAATIPGGALTALSLLRKANIQPGQKVLINGASGGIGGAAVQLAKHHFGAEVTGVCGTARMAAVKALGADHVIDYTREDFTKSGKTYDLIVDILNKSSFAQSKKALTPNGRYLLVSFKMKQVLQMLRTARFGRRKVICALSSETLADLEFIKGLIAAGKIKAVVDRCFPLEQTAEAHRYAESGQRTGSIVITVAHQH